MLAGQFSPHRLSAAFQSLDHHPACRRSHHLRSAGREARRPAGYLPLPRTGWNMAAEAIIKFVGAIVLIELGFGVLGAVARPSPPPSFLPICLPDSAHELRGPAVAGEVSAGGRSYPSHRLLCWTSHHQQHRHPDGEALFPAGRGGLYAAIALVGRLLYFGAWSVVSAMFPVSAESKEGGSVRLAAGDSTAAGDGHVGGLRSDSGGISNPGISDAFWLALPHRSGRPEFAAHA